ncbi:MAG: hypothetical protein HYS43_00260 [Candidatus Liptonbacteria bacterium]|nr:hypothetical protein [Candidatus Liptonbacteria bacterium]
MVSAVKTIISTLSRMERMVFTGIAMTSVLSGSFFGASAFTNATQIVPQNGGTYREGVVGQPIHLNPLLVNGNDADHDIVRLVFSPLSAVAETMEASKDGRTWIIRVPEGARWQDGAPLTSDDILFTIQKVQDPATQSPFIASWRGIIAERKSELEIALTLAAPYAFFEERARDLFIIPKHVWEAIPPENWRLSNYTLEPVGSGPYAFESYKKQRDGFITEYNLVRNERYAVARPHIAEFQFKFYREIEGEIEAFNTGAIDGFGGTRLPLGDIYRRHDVFTFPTSRYYAIFFNQLTNDALKKAPVREALAAAIDRSRLLSAVLDGNGIAVDGPVPPTLRGYDRAAAAGAAADLSAENLSFDLIVPQTDFLIKTAELVKADWKDIGVDTNVIVLNTNDINTEIIQTRNYHMLLFGNVLKTDPDLFSFWHSSQRFAPGLNLSLYESKTADGLIETIRQTRDEDARMRKLATLQATIRRDAPAAFLYSPHYTYVSSKLDGGFPRGAIVTPSDRFANVGEWYINTKRVLR